MQRYLNQLVADVETATRNAPEATIYRFIPRFLDDEEDEREVMQVRFVRMCDLFGLMADVFPPVDRLTKAQVRVLLTAIENLWRAWQISWGCPSQLTARRRYTFMVELMASETIPYRYDVGAKIDFCAGYEEGKCPFGDKDLCWCEEADMMEKAALEEACNREAIEGDGGDVGFGTSEASSIEAYNRWVFGDEELFNPWDYDENKERWVAFVPEDDAMTWLYFYQAPYEDPEEESTNPEDFDDFAWGNGLVDDDLPF